MIPGAQVSVVLPNLGGKTQEVRIGRPMANAATGRDMIALGAAFTSFALVIALLPGVTDVTYPITCGLVLVGATAVLTVR